MGDDTVYSIPEDLMKEAVKLGLKGPLKLEKEKNTWLPIVCAIVCALIAVAAIAAIALSGGMAAPLVTFLGGKMAFAVITGAVAGAAISGAVNSIKGAIKGDFSLKDFAIDVITGLIAGAVGGAACSGLSLYYETALKTTITLQRVAINAAIGSASGVAASSTGYFVGSVLHKRKITLAGFGAAMLKGGVAGGIGGAFAGVIPNGTTSVVSWSVGTAAAGSICANATVQGIGMLFDPSKKFDFEELIESGLIGGLQAGMLSRAQKYKDKQEIAKNQFSSTYQSRSKVTRRPSKFSDRKQLNKVKKIGLIAKRKFSSKKLQNSRKDGIGEIEIGRFSDQLQNAKMIAPIDLDLPISIKISFQKKELIANLPAELKKSLVYHLKDTPIKEIETFLQNKSHSELHEFFKTFPVVKNAVEYPKVGCHQAERKMNGMGFDDRDLGGISVGGGSKLSSDKSQYLQHKDKPQFNYKKSTGISNDVEAACAVDEQINTFSPHPDFEMPIFTPTTSNPETKLFGAPRKSGGVIKDNDEHGLYGDPNKKSVEPIPHDKTPEIPFLESAQKHPYKGGQGDIYGEIL